MRLGRHSRSKDDWDTEPSRSAERSAAIAAEERDPSKRSPSRKDKDYCKPAHGPHVMVLAKDASLSKARCTWELSWDARTHG